MSSRGFHIGAYLQIEAGTVGNTNTFSPAIGKLNFSIPAISSVVSHLGGQVLTEAETFGFDAHTH